VGVDRMMSMGAIISSPVVVGNVVYVGSADGNLYALR
jgi:outer membrane protein assembly factor BamB